MGLQDVLKKDDFESLIKGDGLVVVHFYAEWAEQCSHMNEVMTELSNKPELKDVTFAKVLAEELPEVSLAYKISAVPTFILLRKSAEVDRVDGANAADLTQKVSKHASKVVLPPASPKVDLEARLKSLTHSAPVVLFMKGDKQEPKCGFSRTIVQLLNENNVTYKTFDILQDQQVREGLKKFSNWPTYPQLYINGELVGGLDIVKELISSGEFKEMVPKTESINDRLKKLVNKEPVMLFMKGNRNNPKCGFSRQIIEILNSTNVVYDTFDILEDEEVRQSLKEFSQWPTYPQLYVKGELIGGLDIVKEMQASGELAQSLNAAA